MKEANPLTHPLRGLSLVEASAGTGKTTLLVRLYLRALLVEGLTTERILAVTYTRAATGELLVRIRRELAQAIEQLAKRRDERDAFWTELFALAGNEDQVRKRIAAALTAFDENAVFTIHGFCQRTLADNAFEAGAAFASEQDENEDALRRDIAADFWRRRTGANSPTYVEWFVAAFGSPAGLLDSLKTALQVSGPLAVEPAVNATEIKAAEAAFIRSAEAARDAWQAAEARLPELLRRHTGLNGNSYNEKAVNGLLADWRQWLSVFPSLRLPDKFDLLTASTVNDKTNKNHEPPKEPFFEAAEALQETSRALSEIWWQESAAVALDFMCSESRARKRKLRERGFDDMLRDLRDALHAPGGKTLARRIARQYPLVLVDEFQDTDPLQHEIFTAIHGVDKEHGLVLIGDPKQAIYRFRGADVFTYLQARAACEKNGRLYRLTHNYRSAEPLLTAVNALFGGASDPFEYAQIPYLPVVSGRDPPIESLTLTAGVDAPTTIVWEDAPNGGKLNKGDAERRAVRLCAGEIARLLRLGAAGEAKLEGVPLQPKDIAVLVNMNRQGAMIQDALRQRDIATAMVATQSVFESVEAEELESLLVAIAEPANAPLLRRALATSLLGVTAAELADWAQDETRWGEVVARFRGYYECWKNAGMALMLARLFREEGVIERTLARAEGERVMTNLRHLAEFTGAEAARRPGIAPLLAWFAVARAGTEVQQDSQQLRLESDENLVRIATVHKAKGLQYPVVFLPFAWDGKSPNNKGRPAILAHDDNYRALLDLGSPEADERKSRR